MVGIIDDKLAEALLKVLLPLPLLHNIMLTIFDGFKLSKVAQAFGCVKLLKVAEQQSYALKQP